MTAESLTGLFLWAVGLCIGSFLNVLIYRLPAGLSVSRPRWSFCPACRRELRWHDNIPLWSWVALRGRCRACRAPISLQYPLVEAVTGLAFVLIYHGLFVSPMRDGLLDVSWPRDLPLLVSWLVLASALIACAGMDLAAFVVDTRLTEAALLVGVVAHALWPRPEFFAERSASPGGAGAALAFVASAVMLWWSVWRPVASGGSPPDSLPPGEERLGSVEPGSDRVRRASSGGERAEWTAGCLGLLILVGASLWVMLSPRGAQTYAGVPFPVILAFAAMFCLTVLAAGRERAVDQELHDTLESEGPESRSMALRDLVWLTPMIAAGLLGFGLTAWAPKVAEAWESAVRWSPGGGWMPFGGAVFAAHGAMIAAAAGWLIRIAFTLLFGREAFATGDIFILAAAGAALGWDVALLGFFLAVLSATAGWLAGLVLKRTGMIPFGPWLTVGFLAALWVNRPAAQRAEELAADVHTIWSTRPGLLVTLAGVLLVGSAAAVILAKLVRRWVERSSGADGR
jgi:prepilin signal peptidase PulO-like enzyme (type II secretory pathway)